MQKLSLLLGLLWSASGNIAQANNRDEALAVDNISSPVQGHCAHWSATLLLAATDPALPAKNKRLERQSDDVASGF